MSWEKEKNLILHSRTRTSWLTWKGNMDILHPKFTMLIFTLETANPTLKLRTLKTTLSLSSNKILLLLRFLTSLNSRMMREPLVCQRLKKSANWQKSFKWLLIINLHQHWSLMTYRLSQQVVTKSPTIGTLICHVFLLSQPTDQLKNLCVRNNLSTTCVWKPFDRILQ